MKNSRLSIVAVLIVITILAGNNLVAAQVTVKNDDLIGTWELVSTKNLKTGSDLYSLYNASTGVCWMQFMRTHWTLIAMERGRKGTKPADFEKLSPEEKVKTNYSLIWNEKNELIFAARGGTYSLEGDKIHQVATVALLPGLVGLDLVWKVTHIDKNMMVLQLEIPTILTTMEYSFRRIE